VIPADLVDLGVCEYHAARQRQLALVDARQRGAAADTLIFVEHPHVITLGRARAAQANVLAPGDVPVVEIERGGDVTYHGPGQLVAYPILRLEEGERDLHRFLRNLEAGIMSALADLGVADAARRPGATGVWVGERKVASIGISCRRWVTFHGLALNVCTDLAYFARINPCGFAPAVMTSVSQLLGRQVTVAEVKPVLARRLGEALGRRFASASPTRAAERAGQPAGHT
jgi:lipoyl(octanoyl) transferase